MTQKETENNKVKEEVVKKESGEEKVEEKKDVNKIVRYHAYGSMGIGCIPFPLVDFMALTAAQINMLRQLAQAYDVPFKKDKVKNVVAALVGGSTPGYLAGGVASLMKMIPVVGQIGGALSMPALAGATTYAVGKVFIQHFESGGTFLNFKPEEVREYYEKMFEEGKGLKSEASK